MKKNRKGFTITELVIVIVVIAIFLPYLKKQMPLMRRKMAGAGKGGK